VKAGRSEGALGFWDHADNSDTSLRPYADTPTRRHGLHPRVARLRQSIAKELDRLPALR